MTKEQRAWWRRYNRDLASAEWQRCRAHALRRDGHRQLAVAGLPFTALAGEATEKDHKQTTIK
jgi:hypothetical protein